MEYFYQLYISYKIPYRTPRGMSYRLQYRVPSETFSAPCNLQSVHKGNIDIMGSWFSHITRPLNGLGFMKGIAELHIRKNSYWIGFYLLSYPGTWFSPYRTLSFSHKPLTKWVGKHERKSPGMGSTSSSHNSADSIDVPQDQKETPARNRASTSLKSIVYLFFYSSLFFPLCMVFLTLKYLAHKSPNCSNYRLLCVFPVLFLN